MPPGYVGRVFLCGYRPIPADEAARLCDSGKGRFRREADRLETQGRRPQTDRIAARHPRTRDAFPLQPSFIYRLAEDAIGL